MADLTFITSTTIPHQLNTRRPPRLSARRKLPPHPTSAPTALLEEVGRDGKDDLSDTDKQYLSKVRARLFNARRATESARDHIPPPREADADAVLTARLPDNLDELDDLLYDRGPAQAGQVRLFGGWLDEAVAGRKAGDATVPSSTIEAASPLDTDAHPSEPTDAETLLQANDAFDTAMQHFNKGQYRAAAPLYERAVALVGAPSRLGGQYALWHAQALDALGEKGAAARVLEGLRTHADADVRKVSRELLFIITAPALDLAPGSFMDIPALDEHRDHVAPILTSSFGPLRTALVSKKPEPYTLEWYMEKERPPKRVKNSWTELFIVAAAVGCTLAFMLASSSP